MKDIRLLAEAITSFADAIRVSSRPEDRTLAAEYLSALAPMLARAMLGESVLEEVREMERLLGETWLIDEAPFADALAKWGEFETLYRRSVLAGMTVNERLHASGVLEQFEEAMRFGDRGTVERLLRDTFVDEASVSRIVEGLS